MVEDNSEFQNKKKSHRERNAGRKAQKKKSKKEAVNPVLEQPDKQRNPKAFAFHSAVRAERRFRRKQDIETKKQHIPVVDRTPIEPPPILVAIVGPPKVGKSTVINNLIKLFTKSPLTDIKGPVTIVIGKKRRITFIECNNEINSMIDIAKVADLVLLLCDASFGFEMEIFEFLNICQVHGMPRIMGVLTHLDMIKNSKTLKNTKKVLKHRFWTEVYAGAKLFYLSGIIHGEYLRNEIKNLGRFISVMKFRPLTWRSTHSYLLGDRIEDLTNQEFIRQNPKCDRTVSLYGYVRGVPLAKNTSVHVAGLGDLKIAHISFLPDPCPLPETIKKRALVEKEKLIYAPFSGVGGIVYDKDAVYVELGGSHSHKNRQDLKEDESKNLMSNLIDTRQTLDAKMERSEMQIFTGGKILTSKDVETTKNNNKSTVNLQQKDMVDSDLDEELDQLRNKNNFTEQKVDDSGRTRRKVIFENTDDDFSKTIQESEEESSDSDSDINEKRKGSEYTVLKENKDKSVHNAVTGALKYLEKKQSKQKLESDESELDSNLSESDSNESDESHESIVGISAMKKRKDKLLDISATKNKKVIKVPVIKTQKSSELGQSESDSERETSSFIFKKDKQFVKHLKKTSKSDTSKNSFLVQSDQSSKNEFSESSESSFEENTVDKFTNKSNEETNLSNETEDSESDESDSDNEMQASDAKSSRKDASTKSESDFSDVDSENDIENKHAQEAYAHPNKLDVKSSDESSEDDELKWKENLAKKARDAFLDRQKTTHNIMKLVYGIFDKHSHKLNEENQIEEDKDREEIGGLFHLVTHEQKRLKEEKEKLNVTESSIFTSWDIPARDWTIEENKDLIINCFVTGKWKDSEDAKELLRLDDMEIPSDDDSEIFGDFEDLETGEKHSAEKTKPEKRKREPSATEPVDKEALIEKKRKLKEKFDAEYDIGEKNTFYDDLKTSAEKQAQLNKSVFENMADDLRVQIEGYRAGMYVRIEFENVPSEFINNFNPTYPIVIGGLNMGEENIGYVNVKIKKHRWYKKILKTNDPLIISMGWRRFQTIPLFSKLEDDLKYRYLKYTPEHVQCNAHFWGPITPQSTGFLAIQSCENDLESVKKLGFRIAATGSVQELEKSTQIMKKLKLIGYPLKIYKKTAFIKDMFTSALEVAKFEGARIKTVSGIRGQIKKAVSKPEGTFRATFEDKIQLSDIVFCRTWYKVDVPHFYCPITNLLLPQEMKNAWKGVRTTGELKRDKQIKNEPNADSLYTEIERDSKVFKPLIIPRKLHQDLPYKDKPKFGPLKYDKKPDIEKKRVAVVREPYEQKVAEMLKMLRTSYEQKQTKLKEQMSERMAKHKAMIEGQETRKFQREKQKKKEIFRAKSKAKIREEKRAARGK